MFFMGARGLVWAWPLIVVFCFLIWSVDRRYDKKHEDLARNRALKKLSKETGLSEDEIKSRIANSKKERMTRKTLSTVKFISYAVLVGLSCLFILNSAIA